MLDKTHAEAIARKLKAEIRPKTAHDLAVISYNGKRIASFGIRRGSRHSLGHDHISNDLHISAHDALLLAQCPLSLEEWLQRMRDKSLIRD